MRLFQPPRGRGQAADELRRLGGRRRGAARLGEPGLGEGQQLVLVDRAGRADHDGVGGVESVAEGARRCGVGRADGGLRPRIGRPSGWPAKAAAWASSNTRSSGVSAASAISWATTCFSRARSPASRDGRRTRSESHRHGQRQAALQRPHLEAGALMTGGGVDVAAGGLDHLDDVAGRALTCALEHHVLQKVGPAALVGALVARAASDHHRKGQGLEPGHAIADDADAVGQPVDDGLGDGDQTWANSRI